MLNEITVKLEMSIKINSSQQGTFCCKIIIVGIAMTSMYNGTG